MQKQHHHNWTYTKEQVENYVRTTKIPVGDVPAWTTSKRDNPSHRARSFDIQMKDTPFQTRDQRFNVRGLPEAPESYKATLILESERIRGIDYTPVKQHYMLRKNRVKQAGWHENHLYYNPETKCIENDHEYEGLDNFSPQDLDSFYEFSCNRWTIEIPRQERRLL